MNLSLKQDKRFLASRSNKTVLITLILFFLCYHPGAKGQVGITAVPFLEINNDARSMGMAGATVALKNTRSGLHVNPATFGRLNTIELSSQFNFGDSGSPFGTPWLPSWSIDLQYYTPQLIAGFENYAIGYQYSHLDLGQQIETDGQGNEISTFRSYERAHTISAAYDLSPHISVGAGINFIKSSLASGTSISGQEVSAATRTSFDLGLYGEYPFQKDFLTITPSFGWSLTDFGKPIKYMPSAEGDPLPILMRGGLGLKFAFTERKYGLQVFSVGGYIGREKIMARWNEDGTPMGPLKAIFNSWDSYTRFNGMEYVTLSPNDQLRKQRGIEFTLLEFISLRFGYFYEHPANGDRRYKTSGFGIHYKYFTMDYAEIDTGEDGHPLSDTKFVQFTANIPIELIQKISIPVLSR